MNLANNTLKMVNALNGGIVEKIALYILNQKGVICIQGHKKATQVWREPSIRRPIKQIFT
jgi:hypothetical protein